MRVCAWVVVVLRVLVLCSVQNLSGSARKNAVQQNSARGSESSLPGANRHAGDGASLAARDIAAEGETTAVPADAAPKNGRATLLQKEPAAPVEQREHTAEMDAAQGAAASATSALEVKGKPTSAVAFSKPAPNRATSDAERKQPTVERAHVALAAAQAPTSNPDARAPERPQPRSSMLQQSNFMSYGVTSNSSNSSNSSTTTTDSGTDDDDELYNFPPGSTIYHHGGYIPITEGDRTHAQHVIKFAPVIKVNSDNGGTGGASGRDAMGEVVKMLAANMGSMTSAATFAGANSGGGSASQQFHQWQEEQKAAKQNENLQHQIEKLDAKLSAVRGDLWSQHSGGGASGYGYYSGGANTYGGATTTGGMSGNPTSDKSTIVHAASIVSSSAQRALQASASMAPDCVYQWQRANIHATKASEIAEEVDISDADATTQLMQSAEMVHLALKFMKTAIACVNWSAANAANGGGSSASGGYYLGHNGPTGTTGAGYYTSTGGYAPPSTSGYGGTSTSPYGAYGATGSTGYSPAGASTGTPMAAAGVDPTTGLSLDGSAAAAPGSGGLTDSVFGAGTTGGFVDPEFTAQNDPMRAQAERNVGQLWTLFHRYWLRISWYFGNMDMDTTEKQAYEAEELSIQELEDQLYASGGNDSELSQEILDSERGLVALQEAALLAEEQKVRSNGWYFILFMLGATIAGVAAYLAYYMHQNGHAPAWLAPFIPGGRSGPDGGDEDRDDDDRHRDRDRGGDDDSDDNRR